MLPPTPDGNIIFKTFELPKEATDDLKLENQFVLTNKVNNYAVCGDCDGIVRFIQGTNAN